MLKQVSALQRDLINFVNIYTSKAIFHSDYDFQEPHEFIEATALRQKFFRLGSNCRFVSEHFLIAAPIGESVSNYCTLEVEKSNFGYSPLHWAFDSKIDAQNVALSKLNECPHIMSKAEFREFGTLRAGHRLQLRNLYRSLEQWTIALNSDLVLALILQCLWQAGVQLSCQETSLADRKWIRDSHVDLLCPHFCLKLIDLCVSTIERYSKDWTAHTALLAIEAVLSRIVSLNSDEQIRSQAIKAQICCLKIAYDWTNQLERLLAMSHELCVE